MTTIASKMSAAGRSEAVSSMLHGGLVLLLLVDLLFCALHIMRWLDISSNDRFQLNFDHSFAEWWQYLKAGATALALAIMAARSRQPVYAAWALVFAYAMLDDSLMIHERGGDHFARLVGPASAFGLRAENFGELLVSALVGVPLMLLCWWAHRRSQALAQSHSRNLLWMFAVLLFFGILVDMAHVVLISSGVGFPGAGMVEDGGELFAMSLAAAYSIGLLRRPR